MMLRCAIFHWSYRCCTNRAYWIVCASLSWLVSNKSPLSLDVSSLMQELTIYEMTSHFRCALYSKCPHAYFSGVSAHPAASSPSSSRPPTSASGMFYVQHHEMRTTPQRKRRKVTDAACFPASSLDEDQSDDVFDDGYSRNLNICFVRCSILCSGERV